jgi:hypothetical protein
MWLAARRGSVIAKWAYILLTSARIGASIIVSVVLRRVTFLSSPLTLALLLLALASIWLLFLPSARNWFAGRHSIDPSVFG